MVEHPKNDACMCLSDLSIYFLSKVEKGPTETRTCLKCDTVAQFQTPPSAAGGQAKHSAHEAHQASIHRPRVALVAVDDFGVHASKPREETACGVALKVALVGLVERRNQTVQTNGNSEKTEGCCKRSPGKTAPCWTSSLIVGL